MNNHYKSRIASIDINTHFATTINNAVDEDRITQVRKNLNYLTPILT